MRCSSAAVTSASAPSPKRWALRADAYSAKAPLHSYRRVRHRWANRRACRTWHARVRERHLSLLSGACCFVVDCIRRCAAAAVALLPRAHRRLAARRELSAHAQRAERTGERCEPQGDHGSARAHAVQLAELCRFEVRGMVRVGHIGRRLAHCQADKHTCDSDEGSGLAHRADRRTAEATVCMALGRQANKQTERRRCGGRGVSAWHLLVARGGRRTSPVDQPARDHEAARERVVAPAAGPAHPEGRNQRYCGLRRCERTLRSRVAPIRIAYQGTRERARACVGGVGAPMGMDAWATAGMGALRCTALSSGRGTTGAEQGVTDPSCECQCVGGTDAFNASYTACSSAA